MNIDPRFKIFTEDGIRRYPNGYFAGKEKSMKRGGILMAVAGFLFVLAGLFLLALAISVVTDALENPAQITKQDMIVGISGFLLMLLFFWYGAFLIWKGIKSFRCGKNDWFQAAVKESGYTEKEIREFDRQVSSPGSVIVMPAEAGQPDVILTEEYMMPKYGVPMKFSDIRGAYLVEYPEMVYNGKHTRYVRQMNLAVFSDRWTYCRLQAKQEVAQCLQAMLLEKNSWIDTANGRVLTDKEYDEMEKEYKEKQNLLGGRGWDIEVEE